MRLSSTIYVWVSSLLVKLDNISRIRSTKQTRKRFHCQKLSREKHVTIFRLHSVFATVSNLGLGQYVRILKLLPYHLPFYGQELDL